MAWTPRLWRRCPPCLAEMLLVSFCDEEHGRLGAVCWQHSHAWDPDCFCVCSPWSLWPGVLRVVRPSVCPPQGRPLPAGETVGLSRSTLTVPIGEVAFIPGFWTRTPGSRRTLAGPVVAVSWVLQVGFLSWCSPREVGVWILEPPDERGRCLLSSLCPSAAGCLAWAPFGRPSWPVGAAGRDSAWEGACSCPLPPQRDLVCRGAKFSKKKKYRMPRQI